ncbi:MAG: UDP-N-acetylglucosamine 1-carboxyvinyltransferase, partial [Flavobacteriaceae bacterium]|nr:UDP-N-acetylglucosamine 1-carboxyvinyltransferase [Flavobacteriaceae bacterium]
MSVFKIEGGHRLHGEIIPQGAKNEALQVICAVLLTSKKVTITNIPDIRDVNKLIFILGELGVKINKIDKGTYAIQADDLNLNYLE